MPLHQSGPFQSRIVRQVVQWAQTWTTRAQVSWRSLKTTASWTGQILVYPIYAAFQAARLINLRLQQAQAANIARKSAHSAHQPISIDTGTAVTAELNPTCDTPIRQILEMVRVSILPERPGWEQTPMLIEGSLWVGQSRLLAANHASALAAAQPANIAAPPANHAVVPIGAICGIASVMATRSLVLVTDRNTVLDILSPAQQQHLRQQIAWEVVRLLRSRQIQADLARLSYIPRPNAETPHLMRAFLRLMQWMATAPVAIAANLFHEAEYTSLLATSINLAHLTTVPTTSLFSDASAQPAQLLWQPPTPNLTTTASPSAETRIVSSEPTQSALLNQQSDDIDTPATLVGYIQSPIETLFRWLDRCVFWIETLVVNVWRQLRS